MGGWYDLYAPQAFTNFNGLRLHGRTPEARQSKLIVGPWPHALSTSPRTGDIDFGAHSMVDLEALELRWFDHWLKGIDNSILDEPPLRLFIMGINEWRDEHEWPLARTQWQKWYLHANGNANTLLGDGHLSTESPSQESPDVSRVVDSGHEQSEQADHDDPGPELADERSTHTVPTRVSIVEVGPDVTAEGTGCTPAHPQLMHPST